MDNRLQAFQLGWSLYADLNDESPADIFDTPARNLVKATLKSLDVPFDLSRLDAMKKLPLDKKGQRVVPLKDEIASWISVNHGSKTACALYTGFDLGMLPAYQREALAGNTAPLPEVREKFAKEVEKAGIPQDLIKPVLDALGDSKLTVEEFIQRVLEAASSIESRLGEQAGGHKIFIIMWFDDSMVDTHDAIKEVAKGLGYEAWRADEHAYSGEAISDVMLDGIREADYVVVDLSGNRPNVYFEAGFAHALGKKPFYIAKPDAAPSFDVQGYPILKYTSLRQLREELAKRLQARSVGVGK